MLSMTSRNTTLLFSHPNGELWLFALAVYAPTEEGHLFLQAETRSRTSGAAGRCQPCMRALGLQGVSSWTDERPTKGQVVSPFEKS